MISNKIHVHRLSVDFDLLDAGNVVYHPNYLVLCERARNAALAAVGYSFQEMWSEGMALAVLECNAKYFRAIELGQDLAILTRTTGSSGTRLMVHQEIVRASSLPVDLQSAGFTSSPVEVPQKEILYQVDLVLGSVRLNPIKAVRHSERLVAALEISKY